MGWWAFSFPPGQWRMGPCAPSCPPTLRGTFQGYSATSTWARGHAWTVYGFTLVYRYTRDPRMLEAAQRVTDYYLSRLPEDAVPNWDLDTPIPQKDSSTAAIVASALLELSNYVPDAGKKVLYWNAALRMLDSLSQEHLRGRVLGSGSSPGARPERPLVGSQGGGSPGTGGVTGGGHPTGQCPSERAGHGKRASRLFPRVISPARPRCRRPRSRRRGPGARPERESLPVTWGRPSELHGRPHLERALEVPP